MYGGQPGDIGGRVGESLESLCYVAGDADVTGACSVIPLDGLATVPGACPVLFDCVVLLEGGEEVVGIVGV